MEDIIVLPPKSREGVTVYAADFGFAPDVQDNTDALCRAIAHCRAVGARKLCLAPGTYRIKSEDYIPLDDFEDFILDGCGAEIISETSYFFLLRRCRRVLVRNLTLDFDWAQFHLATLVRVVSRKGTEMTLEFLNGPAPRSCDVCSFNRFDPVRLTPGVEDGMEFWAHSHELFDFRPGHIPNSLTFQCTAANSEHMLPGQIYLARHLRQRQGAGFYVLDSEHITLRGNTIYSTMGMAHVIDGHSHHVLFDREVIRIRPGSNRFLSTDGDGIHVIRSTGYIVIQNCDFSGMGDDSINIHDCNMFISRRLSADTVLLENMGIGDPGDRFDLRNPDFSPAGVQLTLKQIRTNAQGAWELQFEETLPEEVGEGHMLMCRSYCGDHYIIRHNHFHDHRARGLLLQTSHGLVENNLFENIQGAAIFVMLEILRGSWYEGAGAEDITIRNNIFRNCNCCTWTTTIDVMAVLPDNTSQFKTFRDIRISDNAIITTKAPAVYISTCDGLTCDHNHIIFTGGPSKYPPVITERSSNCAFHGTTVGGAAITDQDILISKDTTSRRCMPLYAGLY